MKNGWPVIGDRRTNLLIGGVIFFCFWMYLRSYNVYPSLFLPNGEVRLVEVDSYYHLRHAEAVYNNFPHLLRYDPMSAYPGVERGLNQGFYDIFVAGLSKLSFGLVSCKTILLVLSPVLTGLAFCLLGGWLWRSVSPWCGVLFWLTLAAYPGFLAHVSALGNGDHHSFEVFLTTLLILVLHEALKDKRSYALTAVAAGLLQLLFLSWAGAPLHLFFVGICFFVVALIQRPMSDTSKLRNKGVLFGLLTCLTPLLISTVSPDHIIWFLARDVFVAGGVALAAGYPLLLLVAAKLSSRMRWVLALAVFLAVPLAALAFPPASDAFTTFFSRRSEAIAEHAAVTPASLFRWFGFNALALLTTPLLLLRSDRWRDCAVPVTYGLGLTAFWIYTLDFGYYAPAVVAGFVAYSLSRLPWSKVGAGVIVLLLALPFLFPPSSRALAKPWIVRDYLGESLIHSNGLEQAGTWLRQFKESEGQNLDYGILAPWDWGSVLAQVSRTPVAFSQTHSAALGNLMFHSGPEGDYETLGRADKPLKFIVIPTRNLEGKLGTEMTVSGRHPREIFKPGPVVEWKGQAFNLVAPNQAFYDLFLVRLFDLVAQNMGHYRLVFESPQQTIRAIKLHDDLARFEFTSIDVTEEEASALTGILGSQNRVQETSRGLLVNPFLSPDVRIFETVPGALLTGTTKPQAKVAALLSVSAPYNKIPRFVTWQTQADDKGTFQLRVPYATGRPVYPVPGSTIVNGPYRVEVDGRTLEVKVTEEQIQGGTEIAI